MRIRKILEVGFFYRRKTKPSLLLQGNGLREAGFPANQHAEITKSAPGLLVIKLQDRKPQALDEGKCVSYCERKQGS